MAPKSQLISAVTPFEGKELTIKVRVARLWFMPPYNSNGPVSASNGVEIQMVLCDHEV
ncbi:uncharacterized protein G2W53_020635 [Senna tora]|uniref:Uncharacterized protein n=1 Tax=Senna tora TaxID=362788 RepID=A0A834TKJ5_9FABA|nr:uncharacterized protein G2W53_020635 [Senna tora]